MPSAKDAYLEFWLRENAARGVETIHDFGFPLETRPDVFSPSPSLTYSTKIIVDHMSAMTGKHVLDIGTGTGVLALAALHKGAASAVGVDVSSPAVDLARHNARQIGVEDRFTVLQGDVLEKVEGPFDVIFANLPLVGRAWDRSDDDILALYKRLFPRVRDFMTKEAELYIVHASFADVQAMDTVMRKAGWTTPCRFIQTTWHNMTWSLMVFRATLAS